jgi:hypothetical protein
MQVTKSGNLPLPKQADRKLLGINKQSSYLVWYHHLFTEKDLVEKKAQFDAAAKKKSATKATAR